MILQAEREQVVRWAQRLVGDRLAVLTAGNLSVRATDLVAITPSGVDYDALTPARVSVVDLAGAVVDGERPSTELPVHLAVYAARPGVAAVVHTHPPFATALGTVADELPAVHYLVAELGGPVRIVPYATPGSPELAASVCAGLEGRNAVLLGSHGAMTVGGSLREAYERSVLLEWLAEVAYRARLLGEPRLLSPDELGRIDELTRSSGPDDRSAGPTGK